MDGSGGVIHIRTTNVLEHLNNLSYQKKNFYYLALLSKKKILMLKKRDIIESLLPLIIKYATIYSVDIINRSGD